MMELLMSRWEELLEEVEYEPVHHTLRAGIALLEKYYHRADDTDAYFIAHSKSYCLSIVETHISMILVLDPAIKLDYLNAAWDQEYIDKGMERFKAQVRLKFIYQTWHDQSLSVSCL
jgi:hypothetical protein